MLIVVTVFAIALVLANGEPAPRSIRNGEFNRYFLYNSEIIEEQVNFNTPSTNLLDDVTTVVIVHGHGGSYRTSLNPDLIRELLESENYRINVIAVDWEIYASMTYAMAESAVRTIGVHLATFLVNQDIDPATIHLVGFNLGAHIVGIAGRQLGVARITGLDPSASAYKLSRSDATYVEVIHTDTSSALSNGIGEQLGHADFYPNGGRIQPGCANFECHHNRAWMFFVASINDNVFRANCCNTILEKDTNTCRGAFLPMGNNSLRKFACPSGIYRINTGITYPF